MARHNVNFTVPERQLGKADVEFKIKRDDTSLGTLKVSNGTVVWVPRDKQKGFKIGWADFDVIMRKEGRLEN